MWGRVCGLMLAIVFLWKGPMMAQAPIRPGLPGMVSPQVSGNVPSGTVVPAIPEHPLFLFPTTPDVSLKLRAGNGRPVRGKLISLSDHAVVIETVSSQHRERGEAGQTIGFDRIETMRSIDGRFEFKPEEDFQVVSKRVMAAYASVQIEPDPDPIASRPGTDNRAPAVTTNEKAPDPSAEGSRPKSSKPIVNGLGNGGFGGISNLQKPKPKKPASGTSTTESSPEEQPAVTTESANSPPAAPTSGVTEILLCSNCTKEIPTSAVKSGVCPHCKIAFANVTVAPSPSTTNPFQSSTGTETGLGMRTESTAGAGAFAPTTTGAPAAVSAPAQNTGTQIIQGGNGFSIDAVPNWAKGGLFVLLVLVGWHLMFNR